jgi:hypothetical protein
MPEQKRNGETDGIEQAMLQEYRMTKDPQLGYIPRERLIAARQYMESIFSNGPTGISALSWQERGPNNIGGRCRAILVDKRDASGNTVIAGSVSGGIFRTTNFASPSPNWAPVNDFLPNLAVTAIIQDQSHPDTLFAGTGEGWGNIDAVRGGGIFKSTDGGITWALLPSTSAFEYVQDLAIDNNGNLYASLRNLTSTFRGVMRSTDRGGSWTQVLGAPLPGFATGRAADLEVASNGDIYASLGILSRSMVMKSSFSANGANTGALGTWTDITPITPTVTQRTEIVLAPSDPQRVYLLMQDSATSQVLNIFRSVNAGANWTTLAAPGALNNGANSQTWYNLIGAVDPANANILVVGGFNLAKSTDGGDNWSTITSSSSVHVDHHALVFDGSSKLLNGNDGGIYYSANISSGSPTFSNKDNGYNVTQFYAADLHPVTTDYLLGGAQDNFSLKLTSPGINSATVATGGDGGFCHIDQTDGQLQITSNTNNNYYRSTNGGASFSALSSINNDRGQFINPTDLSDLQKVMYCGDDAGKYFVINNLTGTPTGLQVSVPAMGTLEVTAVRVDPNANSTVWLGASFGAPSVPIVSKLTNANTAAPVVAINTSLSVPAGAAISSIDVDPSNTNHILVTLSSYGIASVFESVNGGSSFVNIEGNLPDMPVRWGMFAPANAQLNGSSGGNGGIMLATELGVWSTSITNGASTVWIPNNSGLANVRTDMLKYRSSDNTVVAATHGRGLFTAVLPTVITGVGGPSNTKDFIKYISTASRQLIIVKGELNARTMTIVLFNLAGQEIYHRQHPYTNITINLNNLARGVYTLRCIGNNGETYYRSFIIQ